MGTGRSRRAVLLGGAAVLLSACDGGAGSGPSVAPSPSSSTTRGSTLTPSSTVTQGPTLPVVHRWQPSANDYVPACKLTAVRRIEALGNGPHQAVEVIDAQYGGLLTDSASVLVVTRSWRRQRGDVVKGGHTYDVRLSRAATGWRITAIHPSAPGPRAPTPLARRVLATDRIVLPPAGAADVASGQVHDSVLHTLLTLAATYRVGVSVVRSGHPLYVFGTDRLSDHPQGRAFDTWEIDGHPVVDRRTPRTLVEDYMRAAASAGSYNIGGPYLLGAAPQWFSDHTHHDHVHAGFLS